MLSRHRYKQKETDPIVNNPDFNVTEFSNIRFNAGSNGYVLSAKQWIERTNAIGLISSAGHYPF